MSTEFVSQGVVGYICHDVKVISTNGFMDHTFCFATSETRAGCIDNIGVTQVAFERDVVLMLVLTYTSPFYKIFVYFSPISRQLSSGIIPRARPGLFLSFSGRYALEKFPPSNLFICFYKYEGIIALNPLL